MHKYSCICLDSRARGPICWFPHVFVVGRLAAKSVFGREGANEGRTAAIVKEKAVLVGGSQDMEGVYNLDRGDAERGSSSAVAPIRVYQSPPSKE